MGTGIYFPISALLFSLLIMLLFFLKEHINTMETKLYGAIVITNFLGLIIEILCTLASKIYETNKLFADIILKLYLVYLVTWALIFTIYIILISYMYMV